MQKSKVCACHDRKIRTERETRDLVNRLNRIAGQVQGIRGMVEKSAYCIDIVRQVAAATAALNSFNKALLGNHIRSCVSEDIREGRSDSVEELIATLQKLMR